MTSFRFIPNGTEMSNWNEMKLLMLWFRVLFRVYQLSRQVGRQGASQVCMLPLQIELKPNEVESWNVMEYTALRDGVRTCIHSIGLKAKCNQCYFPTTAKLLYHSVATRILHFLLHNIRMNVTAPLNGMNGGKKNELFGYIEQWICRKEIPFDGVSNSSWMHVGTRCTLPFQLQPHHPTCTLTITTQPLSIDVEKEIA